MDRAALVRWYIEVFRGAGERDIFRAVKADFKFERRSLYGVSAASVSIPGGRDGQIERMHAGRMHLRISYDSLVFRVKERDSVRI